MSIVLSAVAVMTAASAAGVASNEAIELGREIAQNGVLATIGPMQVEMELQQELAEHPELSEEEQAEFLAIGRAEANALGERAIEAEAEAYAENLSLEDLRSIAAFERSAAGKNLQDAMPQMILSTMSVLDGYEFMPTVRAAFCQSAGKLCEE